MRGLAKLGSCLAAALAFAAAGCLGHQYRSGPRVAVVGRRPHRPDEAGGELSRSYQAEPGRRSTIHSDPPDGESRILGLTVGAVPRGYPIGLLDRFEVVNDAVPDLPFVVARCALTAITAVFDRRVGGRVLHFENSGAIWRDTLVLRDLETGTYWSAATGRGAARPARRPAVSAPIPAVVTRAREWEQRVPGALPRPGRRHLRAYPHACLSRVELAGSLRARGPPTRATSPSSRSSRSDRATRRSSSRPKRDRGRRPPRRQRGRRPFPVTWDPALARPARLRRRRRRDGRSSRCSGSPRTCTSRASARSSPTLRTAPARGGGLTGRLQAFGRADRELAEAGLPRIEAIRGVLQRDWYSMENSPFSSDMRLRALDGAFLLRSSGATSRVTRTSPSGRPSEETVFPAMRIGRGPLIRQTKKPPAAATTTTTATISRSARERFTRGLPAAGRPARSPRPRRPRRSRHRGRRRSARAPPRRRAPRAIGNGSP